MEVGGERKKKKQNRFQGNSKERERSLRVEN